MLHSGTREKRTLDLLRALSAWTNRETAALDPACFALAIATGITSNAMLCVDQRGLSDALFGVDLVVYIWLMLATVWRVLQFPAAALTDLTNPVCVFSFFTLIAASNVLGLQLDFRGSTTAALLVWALSLPIWLALMYFSFGLLILSNSVPTADVIVRGAWLLAIVGTQSLVLLGERVAGSMSRETGEAICILIYSFWGVGLVLYELFVSLFIHRLSYMRLEPNDLSPPLWVVMGAAAISANAGSVLMKTDAGQHLLPTMRPFIAGADPMIWAWGNWWIPLLVMFGLWKHGLRRAPLTYTPMLWSMVFPLGMYAVSTDHLSLEEGLSSLRMLSQSMSWVALVAWIASAIGLIVASASSFRQFYRSDDLATT